MTRTNRSRRTVALLLGVLAFAFSIAAAVFMHTRLDRELSDVAPSERRALFERTLETLRSTCSESQGPVVSDYCTEQAEFITHFPECDSACRELAARFAPRGR